eukprot:scaffold6341_cov76-Phaeocystis_antarctica.AAC.5
MCAARIKCETLRCTECEISTKLYGPSENINSTGRGAVRLYSSSGEHEFPEPLRVVVVQVRRVPQRLHQRQRSHHSLYVEQQHAVRTRDAPRALVERRDQRDGVDGAASALGMVGHACGKCGSVCGLRGAVGDAAVCFAIEAAHARRERHRRVGRVRRRPHNQRRCMPVAAAGRIGTARVATVSARRVGSLCARHVCTAVGAPLRRHPLHQRARQRPPRCSAQLGGEHAVTPRRQRHQIPMQGAGDESRTESLATQLRRSPGVWQLHDNSHNGPTMHPGRGLPRRSLHSPSIISRRCESPTKVTARRRGSGTELQAAPVTGRHVDPPVRHAPPRISPTVHTRRRELCTAGRRGCGARRR